MTTTRKNNTKDSGTRDSWGDWGNHVLSELGRLNANLEEMQKETYKVHTQMWKELAELKIKAGFWGIVGGVLAVIPTLIFFWITK